MLFVTSDWVLLGGITESEDFVTAPAGGYFRSRALGVSAGQPRGKVRVDMGPLVASWVALPALVPAPVRVTDLSASPGSLFEDLVSQILKEEADVG